MSIQEAIETIKMAISEIEWNYPMDYAVAFEKAIKALQYWEKRKKLHDCNDCAKKKNCPRCPGWGKQVRINCYDWTDKEEMNIKIIKTETFIEYDIVVNGTKVGTVKVSPESNEISRLVIFEPYQNNGYGSLVIKDLMKQGYKKLWVRSDNERAIHVYKKYGFIKGKETMFEMEAKVN